MPLVHSRRGDSAAEAVFATYGRLLGCRPDKHVFDRHTSAARPKYVSPFIAKAGPVLASWLGGYPAGDSDLLNSPRSLPTPARRCSAMRGTVGAVDQGSKADGALKAEQSGIEAPTFYRECNQRI